MNRLPTLLCLLATLLLYGCAGMDQSECLTADWRTVGFEDGSQGRPQSNISRYRTECAEFGVAPDLDSYQRGHLEGSEQFCTLENGFSKGLSGFKYRNSCPESLSLEFVTAYRDGHYLYSLKKGIHRLSSKLKKADARIESIDHDLLLVSAELLADDLDKYQRLDLLTDLKKLRDEKVYLAESVVDLEYQLLEKRAEYEQAKEDLSDYLHTSTAAL